MRTGLDKTATILFILLATATMVHLALDADHYQWDFRVYHGAGVAYDSGEDPYDVSAWKSLAPFVYLPMFLPILKWISRLDYQIAYPIWLALKLAALIGLIALWRRKFIPNGSWAVLLALVVLGFQMAVYWDIKAGNIAVFEQLALWLAFLALMKDRPGLFCSLVSLLALIKITPVAFLALPLALDPHRYWRYVAGAVGGLAAVIAANWLLMPELFARFIDNALAMDERAISYDYAALPFFRDLVALVSSSTGTQTTVPLILYLLLVVSVLALTYQRMKKGGGLTDPGDRLSQIILACVTFVVIAPRLKCYSFSLLLIPAVYLLTRLESRGLAIGLFVLLVFDLRRLGEYLALPYSIWLYYPWFLAILIWCLYVWRKPAPETHSPIRDCS